MVSRLLPTLWKETLEAHHRTYLSEAKSRQSAKPCQHTFLPRYPAQGAAKFKLPHEFSGVKFGTLTKGVTQ